MNAPQIERPVDRLIRAFLDDRAETAALNAISADEMAARLHPIVTRRWGGLPTTTFYRARLTRIPIVAAVVASLVVTGGVLILTRMTDRRVASPTVAPSATWSPSPTVATLTFIPQALRGPWVGGTRSFTDLPSASGTLLTFTESTLAMKHLGPEQEPAQFLTSASGLADGALRLTISSSCDAGALGDYTWSLSSGGNRLTIRAVSDPCATRLAAITGDWDRVACKNPENQCLGDLEPGTYASQNIAPHLKPGGTSSPIYAAVTYTVPDGWANAADFPGSFSLAPSSDYAHYSEDGPPKGGTHEIALYAALAASDQNAECSAAERTDVPRSVNGMIQFIGSLRSVSSSRPRPITIDGRNGRWVDVRIAPDWTGTCPDETVPTVQLFRHSEGGPFTWNLALRGDARMRLIVLDVGQGDVVLIAVVSDDPDRFDDLAAQSMPIIESIHFK